MKTEKSNYFIKSLFVLGVFSLSAITTYGSVNSGNILTSTPYQSRNSAADMMLSKYDSNGNLSSSIDAIISKIKAKALEKGGTPLNVTVYNASLDAYLSKVDKLNDSFRNNVGSDYDFLFQYLYPRVYELRKTDDNASYVVQGFKDAMTAMDEVISPTSTNSSSSSSQQTANTTNVALSSATSEYTNIINGNGMSACNAQIMAQLGSQKYTCTIGGGCGSNGHPSSATNISANPTHAGACIPWAEWNVNNTVTRTNTQSSGNTDNYPSGIQYVNDKGQSTFVDTPNYYTSGYDGTSSNSPTSTAEVKDKLSLWSEAIAKGPVAYDNGLARYDFSALDTKYGTSFSKNYQYNPQNVFEKIGSKITTSASNGGLNYKRTNENGIDTYGTDSLLSLQELQKIASSSDPDSTAQKVLGDKLGAKLVVGGDRISVVSKDGQVLSQKIFAVYAGSKDPFVTMNQIKEMADFYGLTVDASQLASVSGEIAGYTNSTTQSSAQVAPEAQKNVDSYVNSVRSSNQSPEQQAATIGNKIKEIEGSGPVNTELREAVAKNLGMPVSQVNDYIKNMK